MPTPEGSCIDAHEDSTTAAHQGNWQQHISSEVAENRKRNGGASSNKPAAPGKIVYKKSAVRSSVYGSQLDAPAATPGVHKKSWTLRVNDDGDLELDQSGQRASEVTLQGC